MFFFFITGIIHIDGHGAVASVDIASALKDDTDRHSEHNLLINFDNLTTVLCLCVSTF